MRSHEFITELFKQSTVPWVWGRRSEKSASASFTVGQQHYRFLAYNSPSEPEVWEIEFAATSKYSNGPLKGKVKYDYDLTGSGNGALVMSTVVSIMREFLKEYKHKISSIRFDADEQSRHDLYSRMVKRLLPSWGVSKSISALSGGNIYLLTKPSDITEEINPDILHPEFSHTQKIGDYTYKATTSQGWRGDRFLKIEVFERGTNDPLDKIASVTFLIHGDEKTGYLESINTWVVDEFRNKGIASTVYAYARMLGNTIKPSKFQTGMGKEMWRAWRKSGAAKHLVKEGINPDILNPEFKHEQEINGYIYKAEIYFEPYSKEYFLRITANIHEQVGRWRNIGYVEFTIPADSKNGSLVCDMVWVDKKYRKEGIASTMYAYARMLGNTIKPSPFQLSSGRKMWKAWEKSGGAEHLMKEEAVDEMALKSYTPLGKFEKPGPFKGADLKLVTHPTHIQKMGQFLENTPYDFRIFVSNLPGLTKYKESGAKTPDEIRKIFGKEADQIIEDSDNAITIVYMGNYGEAKVIMTPWVMAHRLGHAITASNRGYMGYSGAGQDPWSQAEKYFFGTINQLLEQHYGKQNFLPGKYSSMVKWNMTPEYNALFNAIGTQRSSREGDIRRPYEFMYEMFAQYIKTGEIKLNPLPVSLDYGRKAWGKPTKYMRINPEYTDEMTRQQESDRLAVTLTQLFNNVLNSCVGKIFVM